MGIATLTLFHPRRFAQEQHLVLLVQTLENQNRRH